MIRCLRPCTSDHIGSGLDFKTAEAANSNLSFVTYFISDLLDMSEMLRFIYTFLFHFHFCKRSIEIPNVPFRETDSFYTLYFEKSYPTDVTLLNFLPETSN